MAAALLLCTPAAAQTCAAQLTAAARGAGTNATTQWLDPATPQAACTVQVCGDDFATCNVADPPTSTLQAGRGWPWQQAGQC